MKANVDIIIAGGGLGGLFAAICLVQQGMNVTVLERTKEYKPLGGPIQLASNGMGVAHAISDELAKNIRAASRPFWSTKSGIRDGITSEWMFTFDAITQIPCEDSLPFSICIDRSDLQSVLLEELNRVSTDREVVRMGTAVSRYFESDKGVEVFLENGETLSCDILIGADGIWSTVRSQMFDEVSSTVNDRFAIASYTGFKLYSGLPISNSSDYFDLGYSAFIGPDHYFVVCPDRFGRVQWYAFVKALPRTPTSTPSKKTLTNTFKDWAPEVRNLIAATDEGGIIQRDLLDRTPSIRKSWAK